MPNRDRPGAMMSSANTLYRYILNPLVRALLRSPLHGVTSNNIGILHFTGSKTGHKLDTPLSFTRENNLARLLSKLCPPRLASSHPPRRGGAFVPFVRLSSRALAAATSDGSSSSHSPKVPSSCAVAPVPAHRISAARGASSAAQMSSRFSGTTLIFVD